ncbi:hypothetical protein EIP86_009874 [Pleurotus ostreatoroseus]|nr:hypothetical protein EIP86_009874 [Pleurotus ostreatoroseus]
MVLVRHEYADYLDSVINRLNWAIDWVPSTTIVSDVVTQRDDTQPIVVSAVQWLEGVDSLLAAYMYNGIVCWHWDTLSGAYTAAWSIHMDFCGFDLYKIPSGLRNHMLKPARMTGMCLPIDFAHGGALLVGGSSVGKVRIWDASTLEHLQTLRLEGSPIVQALAVSLTTCVQ